MYDKSNKLRLYWLIEEYLSDKINESQFCDEFYYCYDLELDYKTLNENELQVFSELGQTTSRFSQYDEDHKLDPYAFSTIKELREKIIESNERLKISPC